MDKNIFDLHRFWLTVKRDTYIHYKQFVIAMAIVLFMQMNKINVAWISGLPVTSDQLAGMFAKGYIFAGIFFSGFAFSDFRSKQLTMSYLMLPASPFEKSLSIIALSTAGFTIIYSLIFVLFNLSLYIIGIVIGADIAIYNIFNAQTLKLIGGYLIANSILLAGAATFQKSGLALTLLLFFVILWGYFILAALAIGAIFHSFMYSGFIFNDINFQDLASQLKFIPYLFKAILWITPPVFWTITYFKVKEKQA